ncbi:hypothetical protein EGJ23_01550 [Pseudomonas sp. o96-267]|uniref:hypothetical protein n=1 Tax=Pseudomonas sp. o96-267 TaxID=2479853 RepID=UPI000F78A7FD|nr:hypothetical protein [Pseudomonas sp. o96-267]RRV29648.1 hypothetical protein EGJ23_01550 [Pseudomonas sp. o96-267]
METIEVLLIGGPCDGMRQRVMRGQPSLQSVPKTKCPVRMDWHNAEPNTDTRPASVYYRATLRAENGVNHDVYVYGEIDVVEALIKGYRDHVGV